MAVTVKLNKSLKSISTRIDKALDEKAEPVVRDRLYDIAGSLVALSPVWSGAYVTSHSFVPKGSGSGRMRISKEDMGPVDKASARSTGFEQLVSDINAIDFVKSGGGVFRNRSPHARAVEDGGTKYAPQGWHVYRTTSERFK